MSGDRGGFGSDVSLAVVAHELRRDAEAIERLVGALTQAEGLERAPEVVEQVSQLEHATRRMRRGVDALFDRRLSVEEPELRPTHLGQLVQELVAGFDTAGHPVEVAADSVVILADPLLVERILDNLLANALEHTPADTPVRVGVRVADGGATMWVEDEGPGVPADVRERVFEGDLPPDPPVEGPGGLWVARHLARVHGGDVVVGPGPDERGARFEVHLPRSRRA